MKAARSHGVPLSVFDGRSRPGSLWRESDTLLAEALQALDDLRCGGCGQPRSESMARENTGAYSAVVMRCFACEAAAIAAAKIRADDDYYVPEAVHISTHL